MEDIIVPDAIFSPIDLPCGRRIRNRLVKVAMYEHLASFFGGPPNPRHYSLYSKWAEFEWGMIVTGNVQVDGTHLGLGRDVILPQHISNESLQPFRQLATSIRGVNSSKGTSGVLAVMQLCHTGRQSTNILGGRYPFQPPFAPSSIRVKAKNMGWISDVLHTIAFQIPRAMLPSDIDDVVEAFTKGARVALESGFDGVQLHAAHGYLLAQFISPTSNTRTDEYSSHPDNALRLLRRVVFAVREVVPKTFILGIKMNAADYVEPENKIASPLTTKEDDRVLDHVREIASWGAVDFIEISGGDYENPDFMTSIPKSSESPRQAIFARFSKAAMSALDSIPQNTTKVPLPLILLTGGLRTPKLLYTALSSRHAHLLGIGRSSILCPGLPDLLRKVDTKDPAWATPFRPEPDLDAPSRFRNYLPSIPLVGAGVSMAWYIIMIRRLSDVPLWIIRRPGALEPDYNVGGVGAVFLMWFWVDSVRWLLRWILVLAVIACGLAWV